MGVVALFIEIVKATRSSMASAVDHALSALVFAAYLVEFLLVKAAGTGVFLVLTIELPRSHCWLHCHAWHRTSGSHHPLVGPVAAGPWIKPRFLRSVQDR